MLVRRRGHRVVNLDKLTYAGNLESLADGARRRRDHVFVRGDIGDAAALRRACSTSTQPDGVIHFAAESHVDRSIDGAGGVRSDQRRRHVHAAGGEPALLARAAARRADAFRFLHVSTDEVFGSLGRDGRRSPKTPPYAPNSPYSATKAASDHLVRASTTPTGCRAHDELLEQLRAVSVSREADSAR